MADQDRENEIFKQEMGKENDRQAERDFLKDKSIGGAMAPRPTDDFIDRSLGKDQNRMERSHNAGEATDRRMAEELQTDKHRLEHERAGRVRTQSEEPQQKERQSARDIMQQQQERSRKHGR